MPTCPSCGATLSPEWKFCIHCGVIAPTAAVPGAIRPDEAVTAGRRTRLDIPLLVGGVLGLAGVALLVYMGIVFFGPL